MIVEWRRCVDCRHEFGLTRRQFNSGLVAVRQRCGACRPIRTRALTAARTQRWRLRRCDAGSAVRQPPSPTIGVRANLGGPRS